MGRNIMGTRTEKNLLAAFAGESQARNRYTLFSARAREEGLEQIAAIFLETAENEKEHAARYFRFLSGGDVEITASYPTGPVGTTAENLAAAARGENLEWTKLYKEGGDIAMEEGFPEIAHQFWNISKVETEHERRYLRLFANVKGGRVFRREAPVRWKCRNCGYVHEGTEPMERCPACAKPRSYFELLCENY